MELIVDVISDLLTAIGAAIAILYEFKHGDGPRKGALTRSGRLAMVLILIGLLVSIMKTVADARERADEVAAERRRSARLIEKADANTVLLLQDREVKEVGVVLTLRDGITTLPSNCTFVAYLRNNNHDTLRLVIPMDDFIAEGTPDDTIKDGAFFNLRRVSSHVIGGNLGFKAVFVRNTDNSDDRILLRKFGDLDQITYYISIGANSDSNAVAHAVSALSQVRCQIDQIVVDTFSPGRDPWPLLVSSTTDEPLFMSRPHEEVMFWRRHPDWSRVIGAGE